jgi:UDP-glucose 4-epimerase
MVRVLVRSPGQGLDWYNKRHVLVLGGLGFIGSNLTRALRGAGATIAVVTAHRSRHEPVASELELAGVQVIEADVRDGHAMRLAVRGQHVIFHLSCRSGAVRSVEDPAGDLDINCHGTLTVLESLRAEASTAKLVFAGSRLIYGAPRALPVGENHPLLPVCPHGVHMGTIERYLAIYADLHGIRSTALRITNAYGPGQPSTRNSYGIINFFVHLAITGKAIPIYGDGLQLRDYVFVDDVANALLLAGADVQSDGRLYNVGSGIGTRMIDVARLIVDLARSGSVESGPWPTMAKQIETGNFVADVDRIQHELGWHPAVDLKEGLQKTIAWSLAASDT